MEDVYLVILFLIENQYHYVDGWLPRPQPDLDTCEQRLELVRNYLAKISEHPFLLYCARG